MHTLDGAGVMCRLLILDDEVNIRFVHNNTRAILFKYFILTASIAFELLLEDVIKSGLTVAHREV